MTEGSAIRRQVTEIGEALGVVAFRKNIGEMRKQVMPLTVLEDDEDDQWDPQGWRPQFSDDQAQQRAELLAMHEKLTGT